MEIRETLTFDDVLLQPKYSEVISRSNVDLSVNLPKGFTVKHPIIPANMATITGYDMAKAIFYSNGLAIVHRFMSVEEQLNIAKKLQEGIVNKNAMNYVGFSIGVKTEDYAVVERLIEAGVKILTVDIAHGDSKACVEMCKYISKKHPNVLLIAGNVATGDGAKRLWRAGADLVKVGIGSGSLCTTRLETGNGVPQMTALIDVIKAKKELTEYRYNSLEIKRSIGIISDGGCSHYGDMVKALCFSDLVMTGNMFAGSEETPGEEIEIDGEKFKSYVGSSTHKTNHIEGARAVVKTKGSIKDILQKMKESISSGCSYQGALNLTDLKKDPQFVKITNAGLRESNVHNVKVV